MLNCSWNPKNPFRLQLLCGQYQKWRFKITWKWKITSKLREYELKVPDFELLILCAFAHSFTYKGNRNISCKNTFQLKSTFNLQLQPTSKTISRKRGSISFIHKKSFDFIWPFRLLTEISQEMFPRLLLTIRMGTLALGMNWYLFHPPENQSMLLRKWNVEIL